jgi:hypothetical protein
MSRRRASFACLALSVLLASCVQHMHTTDCGFDPLATSKTASKVTWTRTATPGQLTGQVREVGRKGAVVHHAAVLLAERGSLDTLRITADSMGEFRRDSLPLGKRNVVVAARWYWAAFDTIDVRGDSGWIADVRLEPTPQGWYSCIPH